ncbi:MAG TPA: PadR family transcriptional regulator [Clostridia bacterium]|nr:PadR family transcriptional regulator [Clostridia bacterium]
MSLKHGILGLLNNASMTGYDLSKSFHLSLNYFWQAQTSQIYRELRSMEKLGWITSKVVIQTDKPNKNVFSLTAAGRTELFRWLAEDSMRDDMPLRAPFLMKIFFSGALEQEIGIEKLETFQICCREQLIQMHEIYDACEESAKQYSYVRQHGITANFGIHFYEMCIAWADESINQLKNPDGSV